MQKIKCECGHVNPEGTVLCEACGKPVEENQHIDGNDQRKLLNMRYEGSARRSQTYNKSIVDKIWNFFSSVKVGVWLIVLALLASGAGTIFPQEQYIPAGAANRDPSVYYEATYGIMGQIYYQLGFHNLYSSWWYLLLIALIGISLVICSIDRFVPLFKALKRQKPRRHAQFLKRQRLFSKTDQITDDDKSAVVSKLKKKHYKIREEKGHILAEKGRFSRWGPYVNHIGLIIILIAALLRMTPFMYMDEYVWVREGETTVIPGTDSEYHIENKEFILETYDENDERFQEAIQQEGMVEKNFQTNAVIYKETGENIAGAEPELEKVTEEEIRMNHPLKFDGYTLYQAGYQQNEFESMSFKIHETNDSEETSLGEFQVDLTDPKDEYTLDNGFRVVLSQYYPDYELDEGEPRSKTNYPRNPAFVFTVHPPDNEEPEMSFVGIGRNVDASGENDYKLGVQDFDTRYASGLTVRVDHTLPFFIIGAAIFMIGVIQGMYWQHRRIWLNPEDEGIILAGHTNKNWFGLKKDIEYAIEDTNVKMVDDQQELE
ncbi:cytochrome c biogenesis protein ResB [Lentibacillus amyloliquefaciens]|uniref:Cytochrome C biogenesis protein n=1 Tax=Lentibacillus amyloliquefaciens TaxID=1472767 RepID=A0A0U4FJQ1_9BACI|nr:cytochrome c biogenesis protein ResB [Lentibacillus amyloliquefaciens]ALX47988.1 cytochrome C biogenesis protein [Lentibacillus amyloliquefaciens]